MISEEISDTSLAPLVNQLGWQQPLQRISAEALKKQGIIPTDLGFGPDFAFRTPAGYALTHILLETEPPEVPRWVRQARTNIQARQDLCLVLISPSLPDGRGIKLAAGIIEQCLALGYGLACSTATGVQLVLPPEYNLKPPCSEVKEHGHIQSWVLNQLTASNSFSTHLHKCLTRFISAYSKVIKRGSPSYTAESRLLHRLTECIVDGDERLFFPIHRIAVLQEFELSKADLNSRDHFFHTFNDYFLGLLVLQGLLDDRQHTKIPDRYIRDRSRTYGLSTWEALWALTSLFHDPGYLAEKPYSTFSFALGLEHDPRSDPPDIPEANRQTLIDAWDTTFGGFRRDLRELIKIVSGEFMPQIEGQNRVKAFDDAMRRAYFDGSRPGHSIISGLSLIQRCKSDNTQKPTGFDDRTALKACEVAALSMMFHDPRCREKLEAGGVPPIPFELLPYAATLMFVDALQDDRRDINKGTWHKHGVLNSINIDAANRHVRAEVCLRELPIQSWPYKIAEYESVID